MRSAVALLVTVLLEACGGVGNASGSTVVVAPDAGGFAGVTDAGAGADGGAPADAGSPQDAGPPAPDAGPPAPDAGPPAPDAGPPDGGAFSECGNLRIDRVGAPLAVDLEKSEESQLCAAGAPDGRIGTVPLRVATYDTSGVPVTSWTFYRSSDAALLTRRTWAAGDAPTTLLPVDDGFIGFGLGAGGTVQTHRLDHAGGQLATGQTAASRSVVADPLGGAVGFDVSREGSAFTLRFHRFDASAVEVATAVVATGPDDPVRWVAGVSVAGDTLVVYGPADTGCRAVWLDRAGARISAGSSPPDCRIQRLLPLIDGALAVETYSLDASRAVTAVVPAREREPEFTPAPPWLAGAKLRELAILPEARGYALRREGEGP